MQQTTFLKEILGFSSLQGAGFVVSLLLFPFISSHLNFINKNNLPSPPDEIILYTSCEGSLLENIYTKGDFGLHSDPEIDPLLAPGYSFVTENAPADSFYTLINTTSNYDALTLGNWLITGDNSSNPYGNLLLLNLMENPHIFYRDEIDVCPGVPYQFSLDVLNLVLPEHIAWAKLANIDVLLNGHLALSLGDIPQDTSWHKHLFHFSVKNTSSLTIELRNNSITGLGGDIAIDNIQIKPCSPDLAAAEQANSICENEDALLIAPLPEEFKHYSIKWQSSVEIGSWQDIIGATNDSLIIENAINNSIAFRYVIGIDVSTINTACSLFGEEMVLTIDPYLEQIIEVSIQEGESYLGVSYDQDVVLSDTIINVSTCDSIITTNIEVRPDLYGSDRITLCEGEEFLGIPIYNNSIIWDTLVSSIQSDSFLMYDIRVLPTDTTLLSSLTCDKSAEGVIENMLTNKFGCDSLVIDVVIFNGGPDTTIYELITCDPSEIMEQEERLINEAGCDSLIIKRFDLQELFAETNVIAVSCAENEDGMLEIINESGGVPPYLYSIDGINFQTSPMFTNLAANEYEVQIEDISGCTWIQMESIPEENELFLNLGDDIILEEGQSGNFDFITNVSQIDLISWSPLIGLSCAQCKKPNVKPKQSTTYIAKIYDENGCSASDTIHVQVEASYVYIPTAFSPNDDGFNDHFSVFANDKVDKVLSMDIYDRWGIQVFHKKELQTGFMHQGWNGKFKNQVLAQGVYFYRIMLLLEDGSIEEKKGEVSLLK